jgi:hypothetical protein
MLYGSHLSWPACVACSEVAAGAAARQGPRMQQQGARNPGKHAAGTGTAPEPRSRAPMALTQREGRAFPVVAREDLGPGEWRAAAVHAHHRARRAGRPRAARRPGPARHAAAARAVRRARSTAPVSAGAACMPGGAQGRLAPPAARASGAAGWVTRRRMRPPGMIGASAFKRRGMQLRAAGTAYCPCAVLLRSARRSGWTQTRPPGCPAPRGTGPGPRTRSPLTSRGTPCAWRPLLCRGPRLSPR